MGKQRSGAEQRREVEAWRASGESASVFAARRGVSTSSLFRWARAMDAATPGFVRLEVAASKTAELVVEVGTARVRVTPGFDPELLRALVAALASEAT